MSKGSTHERLAPPKIEPRQVRGSVRLGVRKPVADLAELNLEQLIARARRLVTKACRFATEQRLWQNRVTHWTAARDMLVHIIREMEGRLAALKHYDPIRFPSNDRRSH